MPLPKHFTIALAARGQEGLRATVVKLVTMIVSTTKSVAIYLIVQFCSSAIAIVIVIVIDPQNEGKPKFGL